MLIVYLSHGDVSFSDPNGLINHVRGGGNFHQRERDTRDCSKRIDFTLFKAEAFYFYM